VPKKLKSNYNKTQDFNSSRLPKDINWVVFCYDIKTYL